MIRALVRKLHDNSLVLNVAISESFQKISQRFEFQNKTSVTGWKPLVFIRVERVYPSVICHFWYLKRKSGVLALYKAQQQSDFGKHSFVFRYSDRDGQNFSRKLSFSCAHFDRFSEHPEYAQHFSSWWIEPISCYLLTESGARGLFCFLHLPNTVVASSSSSQTTSSDRLFNRSQLQAFQARKSLSSRESLATFEECIWWLD